MSPTLLYITGILYLWASIDSGFHGKWWLALMLVNYAMACVALAKLS